ncbi:MAG TPA: hypothetical protein ENI70_00030 [Candidatus Peregrinibacteria bacterium]|nr:hypothetical protein [Candidatus Peregrinibacteria bacterium]
MKKTNKKKLILILVLLAEVLTFAIYMALYFEMPDFAKAVKTLQGEEKTATYVYSTSLRTLDPSFYDEESNEKLKYVYEGLVGFDKYYRITPLLATSWSNLDKKTWEFNLREGVTFHNGEKFTADDVIFSFERAKSLKTDLAELLSNIKEIQKITDHQIYIITKKADPLLLSKLTNLFILSHQAFLGLEYNVNESPLGTGPYLFERWKKEDYLHLVAFENYYAGIQEPQNLRIKIVPNKYRRAAKLAAQEIDYLFNVPPEYFEQIRTAGYEVLRYPSFNSFFLLFNHRHPLLQRKEIRKAIGEAINKEKIIEIVGGFAKPISQLIATGVFGYNSSLTEIPYNPTEAKTVVENLQDTSRELTLDAEYATGEIGYFIVTELENIGLDVKLNLLTQRELLQKISSGESDFYLLAWDFSGVADPADLLNELVSSEGKYNLENYQNEEVDQLITESSRETKEEKRIEEIQKIMELIHEDIIGVPLIEPYLLEAELQIPNY